MEQAIDSSDVIVALVSAGYLPMNNKAVFQPVAGARFGSARQRIDKDE
jgi:hypothetical protein